MTNYELGAIKLKLDYAGLRGVNPGIIYALLTGYGTAGPDKDERGFDFAAAWARPGIQHLISESGDARPTARKNEGPGWAGMHMAAAFLLLFALEKNGEGQEIIFSLIIPVFGPWPPIFKWSWAGNL